MTQSQTLDRSRAAVLIMDFQNGILSRMPQNVIERAASVLEGSRAAAIPIIYVRHRGGRFAADAPETEIHPGVMPEPGERVLSKTKAGAFSTTGLDVLLRELERDTLILMGVATSGCVLSTARWAGDVGYKFVVVSDACDDRDPEVHRVLIEKIFARQGTVLTAQEFLQVIAKS